MDESLSGSSRGIPDVGGVIRELVSAERPSAGSVRALAALTADAILERDPTAINVLREALRRVQGRWGLRVEVGTSEDVAVSVAGILRVVEAAAQRLTMPWLTSEFTPGSHAHRVLQEIARDRGVSNTELAEQLRLDETEVSRAGRRLREAGLVTRRRFGTINSWEVTSKGRSLLASMPATKPQPQAAVAVTAPAPAGRAPLVVRVSPQAAEVDIVIGDYLAEIKSLRVADIRATIGEILQVMGPSIANQARIYGVVVEGYPARQRAAAARVVEDLDLPLWMAAKAEPERRSGPGAE